MGSPGKRSAPGTGVTTRRARHARAPVPGAACGLTRATQLHRIDEAFVRKTLERHGLVLEAESPLLRNPADKRLKGVFDPKVKGRTDRFVHLYRKPAAAAPASP